MAAPIPQEVIDHCARHPQCKGCPLGTCVAPVQDRKLDEWLESRIEAVKEINSSKSI